MRNTRYKKKSVVHANILEKRRRVTKKNVAILADSLPLSASRHNTMFLKNWQHLLYVYFSCVSGTNKSKQHHNKIKTEGDFELANQIARKNHNIGPEPISFGTGQQPISFGTFFGTSSQLTTNHNVQPKRKGKMSK